MRSDLRYAFRQLRRSPGFAVTAVLTLALGIGANTAIFSIVNAVLRHPAGVDHPDQVAVIHTRYTQFTLDIPYISVPGYAEAGSLGKLVESAAIVRPASFNIIHDGQAEYVAAARVSSQWFQVYGARPILGRTFTREEDQPNMGPVVVLSYGIWQRVYGGRKDIVGQTMLLDQKPYRVIGVMRSDFAWPRRSEIWIPIALAPSAFAPAQVFNEFYNGVVRMRPGVSTQQLNAGLSTKMWEDLRRGGGSKYAADSGWSIYTTPLAEFAAGPLRTPLYVLMGVVALVLLIAAANVAGLFLARASARSREFAIRTALGASATRMMRQLFVEASLLALAACLAGLAAGPLMGRVLLYLVPHNLATGFVVHLEPAVLAFTAGVSVLTLLIAGMGPAFNLFRNRNKLQLHEGGRSGTASADKQRLRRAFVIGEVAAAFLLVAGTGLFLASLRKLEQIDPGFNPRGVEAGMVHFAGHDMLDNAPHQAAFIGGVVAQLAEEPGVTAAAAVQPLPFDPDGLASGSFDIQGRPTGPNDPGPHSHQTWTTPGYDKVMQIPLLAGRWFTDEDRATTRRVVVIDQRLAQKYWPNQNPVGQHVDSGPHNSWATIIGVVATIRSGSLEEDSTDGMRYYPFAQNPDAMANFVVRVHGDPDRAAPMLKRAVASLDSSQAMTGITSVETLVADSLAGRRLVVWMLATFGGLALLLAIVGIYGLMSYVTEQRTNEVGIRMALGAQRSDVAWLVLTQALLLVGIGLTLGAAASVLATALLRRAFVAFGGGAASSLGVAAIVLLAVGLLAGLIPALRAASQNPVEALRTE